MNGFKLMLAFVILGMSAGCAAPRSQVTIDVVHSGQQLHISFKPVDQQGMEK